MLKSSSLITPITSIPSDWTFDGLIGNYVIFGLVHRNDLDEEKISYLVDDTTFCATIAPIPFPARSVNPDPESAAHEDHMIRSAYSNKLARQQKFIDQAELDFAKAISLIYKRLSPAVQGQLDSINGNKAMTKKNKYKAMIKHLEDAFGHHLPEEAEILRDRIVEATDVIGYQALFELYDRYQAYLDLIPRHNPDKTPVLASDGVTQLTYKLSSEEMRRILLKRLGANGNSTMIHIKEDMLRKPATTYEQIRLEILGLVSKNPSAYGPSPSTSQTYTATSSWTPSLASVNSANTILGYNVSSNPIPGSVFNAPYSTNTNNRVNNNFIPRCGNCRNPGHKAFQCPSTYCFTCNVNFPSLEARQVHARQIHAKRRGGNNGQEFINNLQQQQFPLPYITTVPPTNTIPHTVPAQPLSTSNVSNNKRTIQQASDFTTINDQANKRAAMVFNATVVPSISTLPTDYQSGHHSSMKFEDTLSNQDTLSKNT